ncbi:hypothetical protein NDR87_21510 [Nocardia sp. CDC159]|uniref:Adhesin domain-containing protein n=1 Tax=Nocardia pulmonis TaxID=2951408 RepID=A0A9X2EAA6_9NOCA|nr:MULTISPECIES: hypothetical protein [Nocardia]MCM6776525.1 hypothetical protein [Nocardia pulmonis]MCM6788949.1 hypothetical protein [Nocardia sp. CDC159]
MPAFPTPEPIVLTVDVLAGNVTVIASDRTDTIVDVRPADESRRADVRAAQRTLVEFSAGTLTVRTPKGWRTHAPFGGNPSIEVVVEVPTGSPLAATVGVGRLFGSGELGRCDLRMSLGDIVIEHPGDSVTAKTAQGDIRIGDAARGVLRLETSTGELEVGIRPGSAARVETTTQHGTAHNRLAPADLPTEDTDVVQVFARNAFGNIVIRHAAA